MFIAIRVESDEKGGTEEILINKSIVLWVDTDSNGSAVLHLDRNIEVGDLYDEVFTARTSYDEVRRMLLERSEP